MRQLYNSILLLCFPFVGFSQTPKTYTSSEILQQLKKLNVLGSVLYIAAHPDDENTRLLAYLANEKLYRTGYLSLTRGDGGQNLIGDEQGIDLGLIRTQELLAARRIDGAEQFFSRAYDFGFCKSPEEALSTWGHDKILSDVVWVIRKFKPDVIIARFPEDSRAGHGHHAASGILAREAFDAAADSTKFPEQLKQGVTVWQAKRMLWNTFNFGSTNTQNENQFKMDVGAYNPLLGKSYGEIAALSRSQHKSQGFGVPAQRGTALEYFETIRGDKPVNDLMDGVDVSWKRVKIKFSEQMIRGDKQMIDGLRNNFNKELNGFNFEKFADSLVKNFNPESPVKSLPGLIALQKKLETASVNDDGFWFNEKANLVAKLAEACSGIYLEATVPNQLNPIGDSIKVNISVNNRLGVDVRQVFVSSFGNSVSITQLPANQGISKTIGAFISNPFSASQPYWLENQKDLGSFIVNNQQQIGKPIIDPATVLFQVNIMGQKFEYAKPLMYKFTDPVKGELYMPMQIVDRFFINTDPQLLLFRNNEKGNVKKLTYIVQSNVDFNDSLKLNEFLGEKQIPVVDSHFVFGKAQKQYIDLVVKGDSIQNDSEEYIGGEATSSSFYGKQHFSLRKISYDHIPDIFYRYYDAAKIIKLDLKTVGSHVGYIPGAGDKVPQALEQMGYKVTMLKEADIYPANLKQFDAIVTGVRAYNTNDWMSNVYETLVQYVNEGGVLLTQYNTSNFISSVKSKIGPYPFSISRNRVTDETAKVNFLIPGHPALNYPNKITDKDFEGWIQERSIYNAEKIDSNYQRILSMKDPGENEQDGSLIVGNYGKGKFVYTGLVFFRELPAGVPGAYRLFANLIAPAASPKDDKKEPAMKKINMLNNKKSKKQNQ